MLQKCSPNPSSQNGDDYAQVLKASSIIGGAKVSSLLIGVIRTKVAALILGPSGIGLISLFSAAISIVGTLTRFGLDQSGVRAVAEARANENTSELSSTKSALAWLCVASGLVGWFSIALLAPAISQWTFGSPEQAVALAILGSSLLTTAIQFGQLALLRGYRRISDIARANISGVLIGSLVSIGFYITMGIDGIVPAMIATSVAQLASTWWFSRKLVLKKESYDRRARRKKVEELLHLGSAFVYGPLLGAILTFVIATLINRNYGIEANGVFQAALAISVMFTSFLTETMGTDFFPRLSANTKYPKRVNRLVNQQIEVGTLLALAGITATICFAPFLVTLFYSEKFKSSSEILIWLTLGSIFQTISWPIGMIQKALGAKRWIILSQTIANSMRLALVFILFKPFGIAGIALAYPVSSALQFAVTLLIAKHLTGFQLSYEALKTALLPLIFAAVAITSHQLFGKTYTAYLGLLLSLIATILSLRCLANLIGENHKLFSIFRKIPGGSILLRGSRNNKNGNTEP
ncbi:MAG: oligosaccharide flippase family protein [Verrucomicrobiales bacterium]